MNKKALRRSVRLLLSASTAAGLCLNTLALPVLAKPTGSVWNNYDVSFSETANTYTLPEQFPAEIDEGKDEGKQRVSQRRIIRALIFLEGDCVMDAYEGQDWDPADQAVIDLRHSIEEQQNAFMDRLRNEIPALRNLEIAQRLDLSTNAISVSIDARYLDAIAALDGVSSVVEENLVYPSTEDVTPNPKEAQTGGTTERITGMDHSVLNGQDGQGSRIAIVDTGLSVNHEAFNNDCFLASLDEKASAASMSSTAYRNQLDLLDQSDIAKVRSTLHLRSEDSGLSAADLFESDKIPFTYNYGDGGTYVGHKNDEHSDHGTHVGGISSANRKIRKDGKIQDAPAMTGYAPDSQVLVMKVFGSQGSGADSDLIAAIEDAITLKCDAVNMSLSTDTTGYTLNSDYDAVFENLKKSDTLLNCASSNSGAWSDAGRLNGKLKNGDVSFATGGTPGTYSETLTVASTNPGDYSQAASAGENSRIGLSDFSSWGIPETLELKPEISAPGQNILSSKDDDSLSWYYPQSGTSMATPAVSGITGVLSHWIDEQNLVARTGKSKRYLMQSLMMATAQPMVSADGSYVSLLGQGAGEVRADSAVRSEILVKMDSSATESADDGKVKVELKDDPQRTGSYTAKFTLKNLTASSKTYKVYSRLFTQKVDEDGLICKETRNLEQTAASLADQFVTIPANGEVSVTANLALTQAEKNRLSEDTPKGAYIEGFIYAVPCNPTSHAIRTDAPASSIPVLGFYGDWEDPSIFEDISLYKSAKGENLTPYGVDPERNGRIYTNCLRISASGNYEGRFLAGNPYTIEQNDKDWMRSAFHSGQKLDLVRYTTVRNSNVVLNAVLDKDQNPVNYDGTIYQKWTKPWAVHFQESYAWRDAYRELSLTRKDLLENLQTDTQYYFSVLATTEFSSDGEFASIRDMAENKTLSDGMKLQFPFTIDDTAPQLKKVLVDGDGKIGENEPFVTFTMQDNQYPAFVAIYDPSGSKVDAIASGVPETADEPGQEATFTWKPEKVEAGTYTVVIGDYARNEKAYSVQIDERFSITCDLENVEESAYTNVDSDYTEAYGLWIRPKTGATLPDPADTEKVKMMLNNSPAPAGSYQITVDEEGDLQVLFNPNYLKDGNHFSLIVNADRTTRVITPELNGSHLTLSPDEIVDPGESFTLTLQPEQYYGLPASIQVRCGDKELASRTEYVYNPTTGVITFATAAVNGEELTIVASGVQKHETMQVVSELSHITMSQTTSNPSTWTKFNATLAADEWFTLPSMIGIQIEDAAGNLRTLATPEDYSYSPETGALEIKAEAMLGRKLRISAQAGLSYVKMDTEFTLENLTAYAADPMTHEGWIATLTPTQRWYDLPDSVIVLIDGRTLDYNDYTYDRTLGTISVMPGSMHGRKISIQAKAKEKNVAMTFSAKTTHVTISPASASTFKAYEGRLSAERGYLLPQTITVKIDEEPLDADSFTFSSSDGTIRIEAAKMVGTSIEIEAEGTLSKEKMELTMVSEGDTVIQPQKAEAFNNTKFETTFAASHGYHLSSTIQIFIDDKALISDQYTYSPEAGTLSIEAEHMIGSSLRIQIYAISNDVGDITLEEGTKATLSWKSAPQTNQAFECTIVPNEGWNLPESIELLINGTTAATDGFTYDPKTGTVAISAELMDGSDLTIRALLTEKIPTEPLEEVIAAIVSPNLSAEEYPAEAIDAIKEAAEKAQQIVSDPESRDQVMNEALRLNQMFLELRKKPGRDLLDRLPEIQ